MKLESILLLCFLKFGWANFLKNVTSEVFGDDVQYLPVAFGDFNSDKLTDIFVITEDKTKISILLAQPETLSSVLSSHTYFLMPSQANKDKRLKLECPIDFGVISSLIPGDFDGDGGMDVFVLVKPEDHDSTYQGFVMWGDHDEYAGEHKLICLSKSIEKQWHHKFSLTSQPLAMDANGDYITDLFSEDGANSTRCIWTFSADRTQKPEKHCLTGDVDYAEMRKPHSNSYIDFDGDGNADLLLTTNDNIEFWRNTGTDKEIKQKFKNDKNISYPMNCTTNNCEIGQFAFADFNLDGKLDVVVPICPDGDSQCADSKIFFATMEDLWKKPSVDAFKEMTIDLRTHRFDFEKEENNDPIYNAMTPRIGDIDLDGYPDLLIRVKDPSSLKIKTHLLLNFAVDHENEMRKSDLKRGFVLQEEVMPTESDSTMVMATFYDLYENGNEDIILVQKYGNDKYRIEALTNSTQDSDAYFVKVIVLTGRCFKDCKNVDDKINNHVKVPYGTNMPGQTICYKTQRPGIGEIESCAPQLSQTGHSALQLPYTIFGLGLAPNFLDYMFVNVTNVNGSSRSHTWSQIIPNSQMYVIPFPPDSPGHWEAKLFVTPSRGILLTGIALVGTCGLITFIIVFFHWRERRADLREKLQEGNRFHFDAM